MTNLNVLLERMASLYGLAFLGWWLAKRKFLSAEQIAGLAKVVVDVCMPALFFIAIADFSGADLPFAGLFLGGFGLGLVGLGLGYLGSRWKSIGNKGTFLFLVAVGNSSFLPLPLSQALWGETGSLACLIFILGNNVFLFSLGIWLFQWDRGKPEKPGLAMVFKHPQGWAAALGLLWHLGGLGMPSWAHFGLSGLGQATIPLAMLATGGLIAAAEGEFLENKGFLGLVLVLRNLALPLLVLVGLKTLGITGLLAGILLLQASMPSLASTAAYASRFGGNPFLGGWGSFWTSLASLATIPAFLALGSAWGLY
jgi:predicted permease